MLECVQLQLRTRQLGEDTLFWIWAYAHQPDASFVTDVLHASDAFQVEGLDFQLQKKVTWIDLLLSFDCFRMFWSIWGFLIETKHCLGIKEIERNSAPTGRHFCTVQSNVVPSPELQLPMFEDRFAFRFQDSSGTCRRSVCFSVFWSNQRAFCGSLFSQFSAKSFTWTLSKKILQGLLLGLWGLWLFVSPISGIVFHLCHT